MHFTYSYSKVDNMFFIATKYLWNNAHVEYINNWTWSFSLVVYRNRQNNFFKILSTCSQFERKTNVVLLFFF